MNTTCTLLCFTSRIRKTRYHPTWHRLYMHGAEGIARTTTTTKIGQFAPRPRGRAGTNRLQHLTLHQNRTSAAHTSRYACAAAPNAAHTQNRKYKHHSTVQSKRRPTPDGLRAINGRGCRLHKAGENPWPRLGPPWRAAAAWPNGKARGKAGEAHTPCASFPPAFFHAFFLPAQYQNWEASVDPLSAVVEDWP